MSTPLRQQPPFGLASSSRYHNETQIQTLYNQFQSLKSQIYGFEESIPVRSSHHKKSQRQKDKALIHLQESTIKKCSQQFNKHLQDIQQYGCCHSEQKRSKKSKQQKYLSSQKCRPPKPADFSKQLPQHPDQSIMKVQDLVQDDEEPQLSFRSRELTVEQIQKNQAMFHQLINSSSNLQYLQKQKQWDIQQIKDMFQQFAAGYLSMMEQMDNSMNFLNQKLRCLQLIFAQYAKIRYNIRQSKSKSIQRQQQLVMDIQNIENRYENEIQNLTIFYEKKTKQIEEHFKQQFKNLKIQSQQSINKVTENQRNSLKTLLEKAKNVIATKQELIVSLQDENQELRKQLQKLNIQKSDAYLRYSASTHKMKDDLIHISAIRLKNKNDNNNLNEDQQIDFSQLGSVKDVNLSEWENSQIDLGHSGISHKSQTESIGSQHENRKK